MTEAERTTHLNDKKPRDGDFVLYWMQQSQRAHCNPALELAIAEANRCRLPLVVVFGLTANYPDANARHYTFMLQGLRDVAADLCGRGIAFAVRRGDPDAVALSLAADAATVVCDRGYLRHQVAWRKRVAEQATCAVVQVEGDVVVPVDLVTRKSEHAARTIRPKIQRHRDGFLRQLPETALDRSSLDLGIGGEIDVDDVAGTVAALGVDESIGPVRRFTGGTQQARRNLKRFLDERLDGYADGRSEPGTWQCSLMSPYLHFGQISPVELAVHARDASAGQQEDKASYLEELIVRRELAYNYVCFEPGYDRYQSLPEWARRTLQEHAEDRRKHAYGESELAAADTHDPFWNAAMREMVHTGFMHNYMRMYWAKKILEWSPHPKQAYETALTLNNRYFIDGRDANSYANVAWCFGLHDRGWTERPIFGKVRYMNANGLKRKFDMDRYIGEVDRLVAAEQG